MNLRKISMNSKNIAKPVRMWIDGKCYERRKFKEIEKIVSQEHEISPKPEFEKKNELAFSTSVHLPSTYYIKLDKFKNVDIKKIECETNTAITYPKYGSDGLMKISGETKESIEEAEEQMLSLITTIREQIPALQFISIPLLSDDIKQNFEQFKMNILSENYYGVEESIFQSALKLHITVVVFTLLDEREKKEAIATLEECKQFFRIDQDKTPLLKIKVKGLNCMNSNLSKVNVLYAETAFSDDSETDKSLQEIVNSISNLFYEKGFARGFQENVKLHMTLMNTKYRNRKEGSPKKKWVKRETFDATKIMEKYKDYYFGEAIFNTINLSLMSSKGEDGFYSSLATLKI